MFTETIVSQALTFARKMKLTLKKPSHEEAVICIQFRVAIEQKIRCVIRFSRRSFVIDRLTSHDGLAVSRNELKL